MTRDEIENLLDDVKAGRQVGTEDHWWHSRICDFYLDENFGEYDDQKACDKQRILRLPALERIALSLYDRLTDADMAQTALVQELRQFVIDSYQCGCMDAGCAGRHAERNSTLEALSETLDTLAPDAGVEALAALRAERDDAFAAGVVHGQKALQAIKGPLQVVDSPELATLRATNARLAAQVEALSGWRDDPASNDAWCAGNDYALTRLCKVLGVDPAKVSWDGSDGGLDEEADALVWRILQAGEDAATLAAMTPAEQADFALTMRIRGAAGDIAKAQIAAREDGE